LIASVAMDLRDANMFAEISSASDRNRCDARGAIGDPKPASCEERCHARPNRSRVFAVCARVDRNAHLSAGR